MATGVARNAEEAIGSERISRVDSPNIKQFVERALERSANQCGEPGLSGERRGLRDARGSGTTADIARRRSGKKGCHYAAAALWRMSLPAGTGLGRVRPLPSATNWSWSHVPLFVESNESSQSESNAATCCRRVVVVVVSSR